MIVQRCLQFLASSQSYPVDARSVDAIYSLSVGVAGALMLAFLCDSKSYGSLEGPDLVANRMILPGKKGSQNPTTVPDREAEVFVASIRQV